jgi:oxygen-dependent protoporphyrinogen oxidase
MWTIGFDDGRSMQADAVVLALPAYAAADLVRAIDPQLADMLAQIRYNSMATVNLVYDASAAANLPQATGFVVPYVERRRIAAATFTTQKYPHRAPDGTVLLRAFIGGAFQGDLVELPDDELVRSAHEELVQLAGIRQPPRHAIVARWRRLLPEYGVGHVELVREIETRAAQLPGLALAGSAYRGVGIPDCVATGEAGAEQAFGYIRR